MKKKNKLVLVESEMLGPKGHFLDNLIETTNSFKSRNQILWILNKKFSHNGTYLPKKIKIYKKITSNIFKRKQNKFLYILEELTLFLLNLFNIFYYFFYFIKEKKISNYLKALTSNYFLLPRYFSSFFKIYKKLNLSKNDHIFFQTARRKDMALVNFLIKIDDNHPKFHIRVMLPPKKRFKGFFYYLKQIEKEIIHKKVHFYLWSDYNYKLFLKNSKSKNGIHKSNIPWSFYKRKNKNKDQQNQNQDQNKQDQNQDGQNDQNQNQQDQNKPSKDDSDGDGIPDKKEKGDNPNQPRDTDKDGTPDHKDNDSDNDGKSDSEEAGPNPKEPQDTDKDGIPDYRDLDSDNDGKPDSEENKQMKPNNQISKEDAMRLLEAIENDEKDVQDKLKRVKGSRVKKEKDW